MASDTAASKQKVMRVLALGMSRTGTESLRSALLELGIGPVYHGFVTTSEHVEDCVLWQKALDAKFTGKGTLWEGKEAWDQILGGYEAVTDFPCAAFAPELIEAYPDALVILHTRDVDAWYKSCITIRKIGAGGFIHTLEWILAPPLFPAGKMWHTIWDVCFRGSFEKNGKTVFREQQAMIKGLMLDRQERFLEWRLGDGWEPLCRFLKVPTPDKPFPKGNTPFETRDKMLKVVEKYRPQTVMVAAGLVVALLTVCTGLAMGASRMKVGTKIANAFFG